MSFAWRSNGRAILKDINLRVGPAEILGVSGPSGCGKTTLARILGGFLTPDAGDVTLDGARLPAKGRSPVQVIFQHAETAVDPRWRIRRIISEGWEPDACTLSRFGFRADWLDRYPHELSGGELQRVAILRALVPGLRLLIVDEMTAMLDAISQARLWRALIEASAERGFALIAISHDPQLLAAIGARVMSLKTGGAANLQGADR